MSTNPGTGEQTKVLANPFTRETRELGEEYLAAFKRVLDSGWFILGSEVASFEEEFARYLNVPHAIGCANGMEALILALAALGIGPGDEVITTPLSAAATALAVTHVGAIPVFADVDPRTLSLDPERLEAAVTSRTRAVIPVHLYGFPARIREIAAICSRKKLRLIEDCAQSVGARCDGHATGAFGDAGCFSFYPTKNLGAFGDGGAVTTRDPELASKLRKLRDYGQESRYEHRLPGYNSRLDELQAAALRIKLARIDDWTARRRQIAASYERALESTGLWRLPSDAGAVHHLYPVQVEDRDSVLSRVRSAGIESLIHYPKLIPEQECYASLAPASCEQAFPEAYRASRRLISLPINPYLTDEECSRVSVALREALTR